MREALGDRGGRAGSADHGQAGLRHQRDTDERRGPGCDRRRVGPKGQYVRTFGVANTATRAPLRPDFYHRIGSVTKTFTVTAVLQLVDEGKVELDDPIAKYVDKVPNGNKITLRELARMQSGLFNYSMSLAFSRDLEADPRRQYSTHELLDYAFAQPSISSQGRATSTATPMRCCWVRWWRRSAGRHCPHSSKST